jgi:hypothetical protein
MEAAGAVKDLSKDNLTVTENRGTGSGFFTRNLTPRSAIRWQKRHIDAGHVLSNPRTVNDTRCSCGARLIIKKRKLWRR